MKNQSQEYYTPIQLKMPVEMERMIEVDDPVYSFNEVISHIDLNRYFVEDAGHKTGRPRYDEEKLLKVVPHFAVRVPARQKILCRRYSTKSRMALWKQGGIW